MLGSNGAENRVKGHESSKLDQKHLFSTHLGLIRNLFTLSLRKSVYVIEDCKFLKIRLLPSDHFLMLLFCSVAPQHPTSRRSSRINPSGAAPALLAVLSKSPMLAVSKALALEYAANNIRFNTVSPGNINTPMHAKDNHAVLAKFHPLARMGEISDIVDAVLYLQNATFVTGENIRVDGGVHAGR